MPSTLTNRRWYQEPLVWFLIIPPSAAVIAGIFTLYLAIVSDDGLVTDDYYQQGKTINRVIKRDQAAAAHGLSGNVSLNAENKLIEVSLNANRDARLPAQVRLRLLHATRGSFDQTLDLGRVGNGVYRAALPDLIPGHWNLQLEAEDWRLTGSFWVPADKTAKLGPAL